MKEKTERQKKYIQNQNNNKMIIMFIFVNTRGALRLIYFGPALDRLTFKGGSEQALNKRNCFMIIEMAMRVQIKEQKFALRPIGNYFELYPELDENSLKSAR